LWARTFLFVGHYSYIWRYVKPDRQTLAEAIDELE
jgi:hypothetical protein